MDHATYLQQERHKREDSAQFAHQAEIMANIAVSRELDELREEFRKELRELAEQVVREEIVNAQHLRGASGTDGAPGKDGATIYEILGLLDEALKGDPERFQGPAGKDGNDGAPGARGEQGFDGLPGPQGPQGQAGAQGDRGEKGEPGERGPRGLQGVQGEPGRDGKDAVSLDQIREAVVETVVQVLRNEVSQQLAQAQIAAIRQELLKIDQLGDTRPSMRPVYFDMTHRIRNILDRKN